MSAVDLVQRMSQRRVTAKQGGQLEFWHEDVRGMSKCLSQCALFSVRDKRTPRAVYKEQVLQSLSNVKVVYTGEQLDLDDQLVFTQLVHLSRALPLGDVVEISPHQALLGLGWDTSQESYVRLRASYRRMFASIVDISYGEKCVYSTHLIHSMKADEHVDTGGLLAIKLDLDLANLLTGDSVMLVQWAQHRNLPPLARWLHSFYSAYAEPHPYKAETLHGLCGTKQTSMPAFRQRLKGALERLKTDGFLIDYDMGARPSYLVSVRRNPKNSPRVVEAS